VSHLLAGLKGFKILILHIISQPEEDYFPTSAEKENWLSNCQVKVGVILEDYR